MPKHGPVREWAEYALIWPVLKTLEHLPLPLASFASQLLALLFHAVTPQLKRVARRNLEMALPDVPAAGREAILRGVYRSLGRLLLAFARIPRLSRENIEQWIRYDGFEHYEAAEKSGKGVLVMTAHLGNWELSAVAHALYGHPMHVVVRPLDNERLDRLVTSYRTRAGNRIIEKTDSPRRILEALRANHTVGVLIDQNVLPPDGMFVDFFGVKACASTGFVRIALRTGATVLPGFALWNPDERRYVLRFWPPVEMTVSGDPEADVRANLQRLHTILEEIVRRYPDQWLWIHRRWKTRPPGEPPLY